MTKYYFSELEITEERKVKNLIYTYVFSVQLRGDLQRTEIETVGGSLAEAEAALRNDERIVDHRLLFVTQEAK
jgi:hypothetical protein